MPVRHIRQLRASCWTLWNIRRTETLAPNLYSMVASRNINNARCSTKMSFRHFPVLYFSPCKLVLHFPPLQFVPHFSNPAFPVSHFQRRPGVDSEHLDFRGSQSFNSLRCFATDTVTQTPVVAIVYFLKIYIRNILNYHITNTDQAFRSEDKT